MNRGRDRIHRVLVGTHNAKGMSERMYWFWTFVEGAEDAMNAVPTGFVCSPTFVEGAEDMMNAVPTGLT